MNTPDKELWLKDQRCRCDTAARSLIAARKQSCQEIDSRLRRIKAFAEILYVKSTLATQMELFEPAQTITPEIDTLLDSPTLGL